MDDEEDEGTFTVSLKNLLGSQKAGRRLMHTSYVEIYLDVHIVGCIFYSQLCTYILLSND